MPNRIASAGQAIATSRPSMNILPDSSLSTPKIAWHTSLRPAPTSPVRATISPRWTSNDTPEKKPVRARAWARKSGSRVGGALRRGYSSERLRPTIAAMSLSWVISLALQVPI